MAASLRPSLAPNPVAENKGRAWGDGFPGGGEAGPEPPGRPCRSVQGERSTAEIQGSRVSGFASDSSQNAAQRDKRQEARGFLNATAAPLSHPQFQEYWKPPFTSKGRSRIGKSGVLRALGSLGLRVLCHSMTVPEGRISCGFPRIRMQWHPHGPSSCCRPGISLGKIPCFPYHRARTGHP